MPSPGEDSPGSGRGGSSPTHRVLAQWKQQQTQAPPLRSTSIGAAEVTRSPSAGAELAHKVDPNPNHNHNHDHNHNPTTTTTLTLTLTTRIGR